MVLKAGTAINTPSPRKNMMFLSLSLVFFSCSMPCKFVGVITCCPFSDLLIMARGTSRLTTEGINNAKMIELAVICPPIQSMVVVTSPIGDQAPPALAAITIIPANNKRC